MMAVKLVIFDLDGTLLNTIADLAAGVDYVLERHNLPTHTLDEYRTMVGNGMRNLVRRALPDEMRNDDSVDSLLREFIEYYLQNIDSRTVPYQGIPELLESLQARGVKIAVASNKVQAGTERLVEKFFPGIVFSAVMGNCHGYPLKPDPAVVDHILEISGVSRNETVMVGDSDTDIQTAHNAGIICVAVTWGFRPRTDLAGADCLASSVGELKEMLERMELLPDVF